MLQIPINSKNIKIRKELKNKKNFSIGKITVKAARLGEAQNL